MSDSKWDGFMALRYSKRQDTLTKIFDKYQDYYDKVATQFVAKNRANRRRYVRLTGNHDTYIEQDRERDLKARVEDRLGVKVIDALRIKSGEQIKYLVIHGHQFDESCRSTGASRSPRASARSIRNASPGATRAATGSGGRATRDAGISAPRFANALSGTDPLPYPHDAAADLALNNLANIKANTRAFVETLLGKQVAWEYFENADAFNALTLEVWKGDETYKLRHMDEVKLCQQYEAKYLALNTGRPIPTLIVGHSHEPRERATYTEGSVVHTIDFYINSGAAGRFENLIWCVEIEGGGERIVSWSKINDRLTRITWKSSHGLLEHESKVAGSV